MQPFESGTWRFNPNDPDTYTLTLTGTLAQTIYFSDRPERIVGLMSTQEFLDTLGFTLANPPNAALVAQRADEEGREVLVIELFDPVYDDATATLTYQARVLEDYGAPGLDSLAAQQTDHELPESFANGSLFIDSSPFSCSNGSAECYQVVNGEKVILGYIDNVGCCGTTCDACNSDASSWYYGKLCKENFPDTCSYTTDNPGPQWDCYAQSINCGQGVVPS